MGKRARLSHAVSRLAHKQQVNVTAGDLQPAVDVLVVRATAQLSSTPAPFASVEESPCKRQYVSASSLSAAHGGTRGELRLYRTRGGDHSSWLTHHFLQAQVSDGQVRYQLLSYLPLLQYRQQHLYVIANHLPTRTLDHHVSVPITVLHDVTANLLI